MIEFDMNLSSINDVKDFVNTVSRYDFDVDLISGRYIVDAKSIMGIFSLDLTKPLVMVAHTDSYIELLRAIAPFEYVPPKK